MINKLKNLTEIELISASLIFGILAYQPQFVPYFIHFWPLVLISCVLVILMLRIRGFILLTIMLTGFILSNRSFEQLNYLQSNLVPGSILNVGIVNKSNTSLEWQGLYTLKTNDGGRFKLYTSYDSSRKIGDKGIIQIGNCKNSEFGSAPFCTGKFLASTESTSPNRLSAFRLRSQESLYSSLSGMIGPRPAGLLLGMILGIRGFILSSDSKIFQESGLIHILVASGANIIFLTTFVGKLVKYLKFSKRLRNITVLSILGLYAWFIGPEIPIIRASVMILFLMLSEYVGRPLNQVNALLMAITVMLTANPRFLYSASFQLTVAGVCCVICNGYLTNRLSFMNKKGKMGILLSELILMPILVIAIMGPILLYRFESMNLLGVLISPITLIFVEFLTLVTVPILMLGYITSSQLILGFIGLLVIRFTELVGIVASLPSLAVSGVRGLYLLIYYPTLALSASSLLRGNDKKQ